jgi:redox-sensing transcriptional repressor
VVEGLTVRPVDDMASVVQEYNISIAIVAVPSRFAQPVIDDLVRCGIRAILNYAPVVPQVPEGVRVRNIDPVLSLQSMTYYLTR